MGHFLFSFVSILSTEKHRAKYLYVELKVNTNQEAFDSFITWRKYVSCLKLSHLVHFKITKKRLQK